MVNSPELWHKADVVGLDWSWFFEKQNLRQTDHLYIWAFEILEKLMENAVKRANLSMAKMSKAATWLLLCSRNSPINCKKPNWMKISQIMGGYFFLKLYHIYLSTKETGV